MLCVVCERECVHIFVCVGEKEGRKETERESEREREREKEKERERESVCVYVCLCVWSMSGATVREEEMI